LTIPQSLSEAARLHGERPALIAAGLALTHAELDACVARAASSLDRQGVGPGQLVGAALGTSPLHLVTLLALGRLGACAVPVQPEHPQGVKDALAAQFGFSLLIAEPGQPGPIAADPAWLEPGSAPTKESAARADSPWRIGLSSGTTGLQKAVLWTHAQTLAYLNQHNQAIAVGAEHRFLCHRGLSSGLTLNAALCHLLAGGQVVFPDSRSLGHFIEAMDRHAVTQVAMSPALLRDLLEQLPAGAVRFPQLRTLRVAGSALPSPLFEAAISRVTPNLIATYGATELGGMIALADRHLRRRAPGSVGKLAPGVEGEVVGEADEPLPAGTRGALRFRRAGMAKEYFRNPAASAQTFRHGWVYPGDIGRIDTEGLLYVEGRVDDKLNLDGLKIEPAPTERALQEHPAVVEAAVFAAAPDRGPAALFAVAVLRAPVDEKALLAHCRSRVGLMFTPARIFFVDKLPRNDAGKLLRTELARRVMRRPPPTPAK